MSRVRLCLFTIIYLLGVATASADDLRAPFGLAWGMSADDARKLGVTLTSVSDQTWGTMYRATSLPKALNDLENCFLIFGYSDRLSRIIAVGDKEQNDPAGGRILARYRDLAESLGGRYGKGHEIDQRDTEIWKKPSEYLMSLKTGRAHRYSTFADGSTNVELSIRANSDSEAEYDIIFESVSEMKKLQADKKAKEKDAL